MTPLIKAAGRCAAGIFLITALAGCLVKPPMGNSDLGQETTIDAINAALLQAQAGVDPVKGFVTGDTGTVITSDSIMGATQVTETDYYSITATTATTYTVQATVAGKISTTTYYRPGMGPSPSPSPSPSNGQAMFFVEGPFKWLVADIVHVLYRWIEKIEIGPTTAVGQTAFPRKLLPGHASYFSSRPWTFDTEKSIRGTGLTGLDIETPSSASRARGYDASSAPSPSPMPTPTPGGCLVLTDLFYGLQTLPSSMVTLNCAQIPNCTVNTNEITFNEVLTDTCGNTTQLNWVFQFSTAVPGIFTLMDRCWSQVITQEGVQTPVTQCDNDLSDFRWAN